LRAWIGIRYDRDTQSCSDLDLWQREICVCGKGCRHRIVKIGYDAARALDRYLRTRARSPDGSAVVVATI